MVIEALTPLDRTSRIKEYKNNAPSRLFCSIAKRAITPHASALAISDVGGSPLLERSIYQQGHFFESDGHFSTSKGPRKIENFESHGSIYQ